MSRLLAIAALATLGPGACVHPSERVVDAAAPNASWSVDDDHFVASSVEASMQRCDPTALLLFARSGSDSFVLRVVGAPGAAELSQGDYPCSHNTIGIAFPKYQAYRYAAELCFVTLTTSAGAGGIANGAFEGTLTNESGELVDVSGVFDSVPIAEFGEGAQGPCGSSAA